MTARAKPDALISAGGAGAMDARASAEWGLDPFALVEAAGRACADALAQSAGALGLDSRGLKIAVLAGSGNNAADALVMLRALILGGRARAGECSVFFAKMPGGENTPLSRAALSLRMLGVPARPWEGAAALGEARGAVIDGIAGTGLDGPLRGAALDMALAAGALSRDPDGPAVVSIDMPSGAFDGWREGMPIVRARATLAIEPRKLCLYAPSVRPFAGEVIPVGAIFPPALMDECRDAELLDWESASARIGPVPAAAHKYDRGLVEIRAGSPGAAGAALLAAAGAQAAGAGIARLIVDDCLYPALAPARPGVMVVPDGAAFSAGRFSPAAALLGPGWGKGADRARVLESYLPLERRGLPLVLDADAIALAEGAVFGGNAILTPHVGEFAACSGAAKDEILSNPVGTLRAFASERNVTVLLKSHVTHVASPDGRIGVIDGMNPALAAGGSGDVLAGLCAAIAARAAREGSGGFDGYACACAAAALLARAAESLRAAGGFFAPEELARAAAAIAGGAWIRGRM